MNVAKSREFYFIFISKFSIPVDLVPLVYCTALEHGSDREWDYLWSKFESTNLAAEQRTIINALGCTKQAHLMKVSSKLNF